MFPVIFRKKKFFEPRPLPRSARTLIFFFSQKPLKIRFEHFLGGLIWFCVLEKIIIFLTIQSKVKNFLCFFGRFELPKFKVWVFFGVLIFNFWSTMGTEYLQTQTQKIKNFEINMIGVVLTKFPEFFRKNSFWDQDPSLGRTEPKNYFFLRNRNKQVCSTFWVVSHDFVFWKKNIYFVHI